MCLELYKGMDRYYSGCGRGGRAQNIYEGGGGTKKSFVKMHVKYNITIIRHKSATVAVTIYLTGIILTPSFLLCSGQQLQ